MLPIQSFLYSYNNLMTGTVNSQQLVHNMNDQQFFHPLFQYGFAPQIFHQPPQLTGFKKNVVKLGQQGLQKIEVKEEALTQQSEIRFDLMTKNKTVCPQIIQTNEKLHPKVPTNEFKEKRVFFSMKDIKMKQNQRFKKYKKIIPSNSKEIQKKIKTTPSTSDIL